MLAYVFLLALLAPNALVSATLGIRQCTGGRPLPQEINIVGCAQTPCDVVQGDDVVMNTNFRSQTVATALPLRVMATALGATVEYNLPPDRQNGCGSLAFGSCPLSANEDATHNFVFPITSIYPPIPVSVELTVYNQNGDVVFCAVIDIIVRLRG